MKDPAIFGGALLDQSVECWNFNATLKRVPCAVYENFTSIY